MENIKFTELKVSNDILKAISDMGFEETTGIQTSAIPPLLEGKDVNGQAQTGTGKTLAFGIPILEKIDGKKRDIQALILCPTRELAIQVAEEIKRLSKYKKSISVLPVYGGQPIGRQLSALQRGVQVVIGTPGRVIDHINRGSIKFDKVKMVVLDEADKMLDMGFVDDIQEILKKVPKERQTMFFSATMPRAFLDLTKRFQKDPVHIRIAHETLTVPKIEQYYVDVRESGKLDSLSNLIDFNNIKLALVFCNTKRQVDDIVDALQARGYAVEGLHGDLKQASRDRVMAKFRRGAIEILVATDVAARGLDVDDIEAVFNYDIPQDEDAYVHRIGRTGRAGKEGKAYTFVVGNEVYKLKDIQRYAKTTIKRAKTPSSTDLEAIRSNILMERIKKTIDDGKLDRFVDLAEKIVTEDYAAMDVAAALLKMMLGGKEEKEEVDEDDLNNTGAAPGRVRLFINIGKENGISISDFVKFIEREGGISGGQIFRVSLHDRFSFFEVPTENAREVLKRIKGKELKGSRVFISPAMKR